MKKWIAGAALAAGLTVGSIAHANEFQIVQVDQTTLMAVDVTSLATVEGRPSVWVVTVHAKEQPVNAGARYRYLMTRWSVDCQGRRYRLGTLTAFSTDHHHVETQEGSGKWLDILPESTGDRVLETVCPPTKRNMKLTLDIERQRFVDIYVGRADAGFPKTTP
jgi:hypothetical protein